MGYTNDILADVQGQIAADDDALGEARYRTNLVLEIALKFPGARRTFRSGSLAVHTFNDPVTDGDGGVVLDRRYYPSLGPDGGGEIPNGIVGEMCALLGPEIRKTYPNARCHTSKRGPKMLFGAPLKGQDPTVDLVVALDRRGADGLWIPHLVKKRWDASHPEEHVRLLNAEPLSLRRLRRRVIRLLKAWNKQWSDPAFSSFHLSVLAAALRRVRHERRHRASHRVREGSKVPRKRRQHERPGRGIPADQAPARPLRSRRPAAESRHEHGPRARP